MGRLDGKVAIVTGGASGIGEAAVRVFAAEGASVIAVDVAEELGQAVVKDVTAKGGKAAFVRCDVSRMTDVQRAVDEAEKRYGGLDIMYANAGIQFGKTVTETSEEEWDRLMEVNVKGAFLCCKAAIPALKRRGGGSILITGSSNSFMTEPKLAAYCTSKGALVMLGKSVAIDYAADRIRSNILLPGWVDTPINKEYLDAPEKRAFGDSLHPCGRIGRPEEIARVAAFIVSDDASFMTGAIVPVDGGLLAVLNGHRFAAPPAK
jgi:NAD(P)-dependent dehydrogenase (short-subunit alcohol dehydrogenase family)